MQSVARLGQKGSASVFFAISAVPLLAVAGLVIDGGNVDFAHRRLQGTTDLAAIAAAANLPDATAAAQGNAAINGYNVADVTAVTPGIYTPSAQIPPSQRFQPSSLAAANAVQVTMTHQQPLFTTPIFQLLADSANVPSSRTLVTQAIAATDHYISFGIGSGVASFNGGIVNGILDQTIGTQVSLSLIDYQSLASAQVDLFGMSQAIAAQVGQVGETYGQSANQTISTSAYFQAIAQAAPSIAPLMTTLANDASLGAGVVDLSRLVSFGPYADFPSNGPEPQANITASAWQLVQAAMQLNGSPHLINLDLNAGIPGIATVTGMMTLGEPAQYSTLLSVNQTGTSVHTSQIRLFLDITLGSAIDGAAVQLPLYLEVGYGTATFNSLSCNALDPSQTHATLDVAPGLVNGWIGNVTAAQMVNFQAEPTVTPATLLNILGLASVTGAANAKIGNPPAPVTFNASDIANATIKTSSTTDFTASLINSLLGNLTMQVNALGAGVQLPGLTQQVAAALAAGASPADTLLTGVLQTTGFGLGQASTWITGARCSAATIVG